MPEFGGPDPAPNDPSDSNIQPRHLHSVPAETENPDLEGSRPRATNVPQGEQANRRSGQARLPGRPSTTAEKVISS